MFLCDNSFLLLLYNTIVNAKIKINIKSEIFFRERLNLKTLIKVLVKSSDIKTVSKLNSLTLFDLIYNNVNGINRIVKLTKTGSFM
tara:strand:- start:1245 stop:1502 length:258 start_codon:yes stop_codon:yes gene_type:complete